MSTFAYFSDYFGVEPDLLEDHGALNVLLLADLPLFIDPFLLFNSKKPAYQTLHDDMIRYLRFLCRKSTEGRPDEGRLNLWYRFPEVKQTWLGFSVTGNSGRGLGKAFASALDDGFENLFQDFGSESITKGSHLEKMCLLKSGVGRDMISDFTTNLIKGYLCEYTQEFVLKHVDASKRRRCHVSHVTFNYDTETWIGGQYDLPFLNDSFVLLTPKEILTKDDVWINKADLYHNFHDIADALPNDSLRAAVNNYFASRLPKTGEPKKEETQAAIHATIRQYPLLYDYYIYLKEQRGDEAVSISKSKVEETERIFIEQVRDLLIQPLDKDGRFYATGRSTEEECKSRIGFLKDLIENKGGHRAFYNRKKPLNREEWLQIMFRAVWYGTNSDVSREVNDGRGPVDFKVSRGAHDKSLVEMKLASNSKLEQNLAKQAEIYKKASDAEVAFKVILFFTQQEEIKVKTLLKKLGIDKDQHVVLIDARIDNKPSASNAR